MPPKKKAAVKPKGKALNGTQRESVGPTLGPEAPKEDVSKHGDAGAKEGASSKPTIPSKRKAKTMDKPAKAPRRSGRGAAQTSIDTIKMLQYLISPSCLDLCRPKDEIQDIKERGPSLRTYSSSTFTPFEEMVCALILSRPISHALGLRSIRTVFNEPFNFTTPKKIRDAGDEGRRTALEAARTQHRQKTAEELGGFADAVIEALGNGEEDTSLERVRVESGHDVEKEREMLKKHIKGLGKTGLDIFFRRIQGVWPKSYPFADQRTLSAIVKLGFPDTAEGLKELLDEKWGELSIDDIKARDEEEKKRKVFVRLLERAVGADLEGNVDAIKSASEAV